MAAVDQYISINSLSLASAAEDYAARGYRVLPLQPNSKLPMRGWSWARTATKDIQTVRDWWQLWPDANIGLAMGAGSGVNALDIDVKGGQDGRGSYQALTHDLYNGPLQQTPSGGQHLLFTYTPGLKNFTHKGEAGGLDMRTDGGYIVATPSVTPEGRYLWTQDGAILDAPTSVAAACAAWSTQGDTVTVEAPEVPQDLPDHRMIGLASKYLDYLNSGDTRAWSNDESRAVYAVAGALMRRLNDPGLVYGIMSNNPYAWACAERHCQFGNVGDWLWKYGISKMVKQATRLRPEDVFKPVAGFTQPGATTTIPHPTLLALPTQAQAAAPALFHRGDYVVANTPMVPKWIVRGIMEAGQVGLIYGDTQALKSYLMLDMAVAISMGVPWCGRTIVNPGPVWILAGEGNVVLGRRLEALRQQKGYTSDDLKNLYISTSGLNLMDRDDHLRLGAQLQHSGGVPPAVLFIDTLSTNALLNENDAQDAAQLVSYGYEMSQAWGTTVAYAHHVTKGNLRSARGSGVFVNNTDFRYRIEKIQGPEVRTKLIVEKLKGAVEPKDPMVFQGVIKPLMGIYDDELAPVTEMHLKPVTDKPVLEAIAAEASRGPLKKIQNKFLGEVTLLISRWRSMDVVWPKVPQGELFEAYHRDVNPSTKRNNFYRAIRRLETQGYLKFSSVDGKSVADADAAQLLVELVALGTAHPDPA